VTERVRFNEYEVGGCVRDELMGRRPHDVDVAMEPVGDDVPNTAAAFELMCEHLEERGFRIFKRDPKFVTVRAHWPDHYHDKRGTADFVLCRRDGGYTDGRRPDHVAAGTIHDDLARRDFTMNAIARDVRTGELLDPFDGAGDVERKLIRCVGDPTARLTEDPLRVVRALRFSVTLGFDVDEPTLAAIHGLDPALVLNVAKERRRDELEKMFAADTRAAMTLLEHELHDVELTDAIMAGVRLRPTFTFKGDHAGRART
jgi:tRNA nucleotidyltransferase/poly(A) polymerase